jgi:hypothetical protein
MWTRRIALVVIILVLAFRNYGGTLSSLFRNSKSSGDVIITKTEFRPDLRDGKPAWIIGLRNQSKNATYNQYEFEATYIDKDGKPSETDKMVLRQKLVPGDEQVIASPDFKARPGAVAGTIKLLTASR